MFPIISPTYFVRRGVQIVRLFIKTKSGLYVWRYCIMNDPGALLPSFAYIMMNPNGGIFTTTVKVRALANYVIRGSFDSFDAAENFILEG